MKKLLILLVFVGCGPSIQSQQFPAGTQVVITQGEYLGCDGVATGVCTSTQFETVCQVNLFSCNNTPMNEIVTLNVNSIATFK